MPTFKELKNKLKITPSEEIDNIDTKSASTKETEKNINTTFETEEVRYMLNLIANSDFKGRDIQVVYNIALKLQEILQETLK